MATKKVTTPEDDEARHNIAVAAAAEICNLFAALRRQADRSDAGDDSGLIEGQLLSAVARRGEKLGWVVHAALDDEAVKTADLESAVEHG
jgi:hypothetical protein